jgi:hypothetical protein
MLIGNRQMHFGCAQVPVISRIPKPMVNFSKDVTGLKDELTKALAERYHEFLETIDDSVSQTLAFMITMGATTDIAKPTKKIILWKKFVDLSPIYEGIAAQLTSMLTKHHCPKMYEEMSKGHVYSHYKLTVMKEAVLYTMEYLAKENLLQPVEVFLNRPNVERWLKGVEE